MNLIQYENFTWPYQKQVVKMKGSFLKYSNKENNKILSTKPLERLNYLSRIYNFLNEIISVKFYSVHRILSVKLWVL